MKMRIAIVTGIVGAIALAASGSASASSDAVRCAFEAKLAYDPAVSMASGDASFASKGGTTNCVGRASGELVLGIGSLELQGTAGTAPTPSGGESCVIGGGSGSLAMRVPEVFALFDPDPYRSFAGEFEYHRVGTAWEATGSVSGPDDGANLVIAGLEQASGGGCMTESKTSSTLSGEILVGGAARQGTAAPCPNQVSGTRRGERLEGTGANDMLSGFGGRDRIVGKGGADCLFGGRGADRIRGGAGVDAIHCGGGFDTVIAARRDRVGASCERLPRG